MVNSNKNSPPNSRPASPTGDEIKKTVADLEAELTTYKQAVGNFKTALQGMMNEINKNEQEIADLKSGQSTSNKELKEAVDRAKKEGDDLKAEILDVQNMLQNWNASRSNNS